MCCLWAVFKSPAAVATHPARAASLPPGNEQAMSSQGKALQSPDMVPQQTNSLLVYRQS